MIGPFAGRYAFLSNFFVAPVTLRGFTYPTNEHWYQSNKARTATMRTYIIDAPTPKEAKKRGRLVRMNDTFEQDKINIMMMGLLLKFEQHPELAEALAGTGDEELVEVNTWGDHYWGMIRNDSGTLVGHNHLGKCLMQIRKMYR